MRFNAVDSKVPLLLLFFIMLVVFIISKWLIFLILAIIFIFFTKIKYQFVINDSSLSFVVSLFGLNISKRRVNKENIKLIEFKRIGWHQKSVFIRLKKGLKWKIFRFQPDNFDEYMENFATANSINMKRHNNY
ncbi:hypothetical protein PB01_10985 [Psychrobacillus glaciei]|uniref:DUF5673 domain-containing protein n=1 Tax=Psychrobacillus glaciei TaxID=2283160 RepID=A0A5J6SSV0_9BACI|nr:hypothetical protein [Psychrobacillus glaciei]QFF99307.1 hypothetical protein PB01_10985 [Psychrobacillus glaciei]